MDSGICRWGRALVRAVLWQEHQGGGPEHGAGAQHCGGPGENFHKEYNDLILGNAINKCKGLITRSRFKDGKLEQSVIDHVIVNDTLEKDIESIIDEQGLHKMVSYKKDASDT